MIIIVISVSVSVKPFAQCVVFDLGFCVIIEFVVGGVEAVKEEFPSLT